MISENRPLILGILGPKLDAGDLMMVADLRPTGFILFDRNIKNPEQTRALTDSLRMVCGHNPLIAIDQEGGNVSRLKSIVGPIPSAAQLGNYNKLNVTRYAARLTGELLRMLGINWNLAPVLDIAGKSIRSNSLDNRCFGKTPERVIQHADAFIDGLHDAGILCCGKHFPGMGDADADPHHGRSVVTSSLSKINTYDLLPFNKLAAKLDSIMLSHAIYPNFTESSPASLSKTVCYDMLAKLRGFQGMIITDDLDMRAISAENPPEHTFDMALEAGNDLLLVCHEMERLTPEMIPWNIDINRCPKCKPPLPYSPDKFQKTAKALNGLCPL